MVILKKSTECTKTTFKNVYKYTFKRVWFKYVAISKQSVSFTKPRFGPAFASYFSNLLLTNILSPYKRKWQLSICEGGRGDANNPNYNPAFIHIQSAFCQNHNSSAFKTKKAFASHAKCVKSCLTCPDSIFVYLEAELPATRVMINRTHVIRT